MLRELVFTCAAALQEANSGIWSFVLQKQLPAAESELCAINKNAALFFTYILLNDEFLKQ